MAQSQGLRVECVEAKILGPSKMLDRLVPDPYDLAVLPCSFGRSVWLRFSRE